jgi:hypothetical protein
MTAAAERGVQFQQSHAEVAQLESALAAYKALPANEPTNLGGVPFSKIANEIAPGFITKPPKGDAKKQ